MSAGERTIVQAGQGGAARVAAFGPFRLELDPPRLLAGGAPVKLGRRALELLAALVRAAGHVVSRAELERQVWPRTVVEDSSLRVHVAALRRALGDGVDGARYIANVPGRGYSFVAPVVLGTQPEPAQAPSGPAAQARPRLPPRLTSIVGRDDVLAALAADLPRRRLVTIVGHGGIGKTSLALAVGARLEDGYPDGACFVDLAPVQDAGEVAMSVASALGVAATHERPQAALLEWLAPRRILLIVDNCEHLVAAATALIEAIVRSAPGVHVLATSREPLDADGEWVFRLAPLCCPPEGARLDVADAMAYSALRLLAERAAASNDAFELTGDMLDSAAALCRRVDGVPLAIEFAAARVGLLGIGGVAAQLDDRLRLLGSGRRTVLPRHRTLRALLDWSYDLLTPDERRVLAGCAVFVGPFTLASAVAVVATGDLAPAAVRLAVLSLAGKSLLCTEQDAGLPLFGLLGITRAYALDRLAANPQGNAVAARHAAHVLELLVQCRVEASRPGGDCLPAVRRAAWNLRGALEWAYGPDGDPALAVRMTAAMPHELGMVLSQGEMTVHVRKALLLVGAGVAIDPADAMRLRVFQAAFTVPETEDGARGLADSLVAAFEGDLDPALRDQQLDEQMEALYSDWGDRFRDGDFRGALQATVRGGQLALGAGDDAALQAWKRMRAQALHFLGEHTQAGAVGADVLARVAMPLPRHLTSPVDRRISMRIVLARVAWMQGEGGRAAALLDEAQAVARASAHPLPLAHVLALAACPLALWRGDDGAAARHADELAEHARRHALDYWTTWAAMFHAVLAVRGGAAAALAPLACDANQADHVPTFAPQVPLADALRRCTGGRVGWNAPEVFRVYGEQLRARGDSSGARYWIDQGLAVARRQGARAWELRCLASRARDADEGRAGAAVAALEELLARLPAGPDDADRRAARRLLGQTA